MTDNVAVLSYSLSFYAQINFNPNVQPWLSSSVQWPPTFSLLFQIYSLLGYANLCRARPVDFNAGRYRHSDKISKVTIVAGASRLCTSLLPLFALPIALLAL